MTNHPARRIAFRVLRDIFVPHNLQRHMLALQLAVDRRPVRFGTAAMASLNAGGAVKRRLQHRIAGILHQRPRQTRNRCAPQRPRTVEGEQAVEYPDCDTFTYLYRLT